MIDLNLGPPVNNMTKEVTVFESYPHDDDWPPENIEYFEEWIKNIKREIPERYHRSTYIKIGLDLDNQQPIIKVSYYRVETPDEFDARLKEYDEAVAEKEVQDAKHDNL